MRLAALQMGKWLGIRGVIEEDFLCFFCLPPPPKSNSLSTARPASGKISVASNMQTVYIWYLKRFSLSPLVFYYAPVAQLDRAAVS